jgi:hypothetical protein
MTHEELGQTNSLEFMNPRIVIDSSRGTEENAFRITYGAERGPLGAWMYAYNVAGTEGVESPPGKLVEAEEGTEAGGCVNVGDGESVAACCANPDWSATALTCTAKMPIKPGIPIPRIKRIARKDWRFLARIDLLIGELACHPFPCL